MKENNLNEDFVTYGLAIKLKEKEFDYKCHYCYKNSIIMSHCSEPLNHNADAVTYSAPTISQVLKWLRNTHNLHVETYPCGLGMWKFLVTNVTTLEERALCDKYTSSERASVAGIEYVLDNLILLWQEK